MSAPMLSLRGVTAGYGTTTVIRDVDLDAGSGVVTALLGANGAGKTTLLGTIAGLRTATSGEVRIDDRDVTRLPAHERARAHVCLVPEGRGIFRRLTVRENLALQADAAGVRDGVDRAVAAFPVLGERLRQLAGTLSGGQQQMLALAAAHVRRPGLILVDEASLGLAPIVLDEIFGFLRAAAEQGAAVVVVDQFAARALAVATDAYVMRKGRIVFGGPAGDLLDADVFAHYLGRG